MERIRKVFVLKQVESGFSNCMGKVSGILRIEENENYNIFLTVINIVSAENGNYVLYLSDGKNEKSFSLEKKPNSFNSEINKELFNFNSDIFIGLFYITNDLPILVAMGNGENCNSSETQLKKLFSNFLLVKAQQEKMYNDEAVATENYFEEEKADKDKTILSENKYDDIYNEFSTKHIESEEKESENGKDFAFIQDEENSAYKPYYESAKKELDDLFNKFPPYEELKKFFPASKWVKINYATEKYYVVGVIKEDKKEKYICYGVPEKYSEKPPKELDGYAVFIPLSVFDLTGDGFWMMFQDAITGKCIKK